MQIYYKEKRIGGIRNMDDNERREAFKLGYVTAKVSDLNVRDEKEHEIVLLIENHPLVKIMDIVLLKIMGVMDGIQTIIEKRIRRRLGWENL
jgi:hypothetical protein